jgi:pSer/pThr/pTyr-binding forkhead associated (FHA) protein
VGERIEVERELILGREDADILIEDPEVSRRHAIVRRSGDGLVIEDSGSTNGTFVNGTPISGPTQLSPGDLVRVGQSEFVLEVPTVASTGDPAQTIMSEPTGTGDSAVSPGGIEREHAYSTEELPARVARRAKRQATGELKTPERAERARALLKLAGVVTLALVLLWAVTRLVADDVSVEEFRASVDDVCEQSLARLDRVELPTSNPRALRRAANQAASVVTKMRRDIAAIERPEETGRNFANFISRVRRVNRTLSQLRRSAGAPQRRVRAAREAVNAAASGAQRAALAARLDACSRWPRL